MTQPTPGPWTVHDDNGRWNIYGPDNYKIHDSFNAGVCGPEIADANRRLIETAPDFLAACRGSDPHGVNPLNSLHVLLHEYVAMRERLDDDDEGYVLGQDGLLAECRGLLAALTAAVKKAEGGA